MKKFSIEEQQSFNKRPLELYVICYCIRVVFPYSSQSAECTVCVHHCHSFIAPLWWRLTPGPQSLHQRKKGSIFTDHMTARHMLPHRVGVSDASSLFHASTRWFLIFFPNPDPCLVRWRKIDDNVINETNMFSGTHKIYYSYSASPWTTWGCLHSL